MNTLQDASIKIKKKARAPRVGDRHYICGACQKAYKSYPALYLHIKRKHEGVRPANTRAAKPISPLARDKVHTGRPQKPSHDVDSISEAQIYLENAQSELLGFLGERLGVISFMDTKPKLEEVVSAIQTVTDSAEEESLKLIKKQTVELLGQLKRRDSGHMFEIEMDYDAFHTLDPNEPLKILAWFLMWLGKYIVKLDFLKTLTSVFARIYKVLIQKGLQIQDLDNKIVWNGVIKECEPLLSSFAQFEGKKELTYEFISKACHLIGKVFE